MTPTETRDKVNAAVKAPVASWDDESSGDAGGEAAFKALTREEAQALRAKNPLLSPWKVVAAQAVAGVVFTALWWLFAEGSVKAWSALYGAVAVVLPNALMAWGTTRRPVTNASAAVLSFAVWELVKILLVITILVVVAKQVADLSWVAMLLTMMGCLKVNWLVLLARGRNKSISDGN